ncbi:hypothetical protein [Sphingorhabdus sp. YGSMI21]|uniref:hypothetical protein n=1 Tax=Sphingorhabdus sp. YGSMI21 TaxID=2077182 RepID=UPI0013DB6A8C|nr:hypothetical protein [Sphingorhabdus sp. YGSMI21]
MNRFCGKVYRLAVRMLAGPGTVKRRFAKAVGAATYGRRSRFSPVAPDHDKDARAPSQ